MSSITNYDVILNLTSEQAEVFCGYHDIALIKTYAEPGRLVVPEYMKTVPNRVEIEMYLDAEDVHRVGMATFYRNGELLTTVSTDECDECGGPCDGVHAKVSNRIDAKEKEKRIQELTDRILKHETSVVEEVIKHMNALRVNVHKLVSILSAENPDDVTEVLTRVKNMN
jgi:hypothetical protein